jgi:hypothetical protein
MPTLPTILDVLENALGDEISAGRAERLSIQEVDELYASVNAFYDAWDPPLAPQDTLRVHLGGWIARSGATGTARDLLNLALLYAHEAVIYDPVAAYFQHGLRKLRPLPTIQGPGLNSRADWVRVEASAGYEIFEGNLEAHQSHLALAFERIAQQAPLIRSGVAIPIPHLRMVLQQQDSIFTAVRHMVRDDDYRSLLANPIDRAPLMRDETTGVRIQVQPRTRADAVMQEAGEPAYYLARTLALAMAADASYLPPSATEWAIYEQRLGVLQRSLPREERQHLHVLPALASCSLPFLQGLDPKTVAAVRSNEEAMDDWRGALRRATRNISALPSTGETFAAEARDVLADELGPVAREVERATRRSAVLSDSFKGDAINWTCGAAVAGLGTAIVGLSPAAVPLTAATGIVRWLARSLVPVRLTGQRAVIAHLSHARPEPGESKAHDGWPSPEALILRRK